MAESHTISHRAALRIGTGALLSVLTARRFGGLIADSLADDARIILLYATKYGATRDTAQWIAEGLQRPVELIDIRDHGLPVSDAEKTRFILGSAVLSEGPIALMPTLVASSVMAPPGAARSTRFP